jgi:hypothetical protein
MAESKNCGGKSLFCFTNWLRQKSDVGHPYITGGVANMEVWEDGIPYLSVGCYKLWKKMKK